MQNHGKRGRLSRPAGSARGGRMGTRGPQPMHQTPAHRETLQGIYTDQHFTHAAAVLKGCTVHIQVKNGKVYEGVLCTISPQGEVVLEAAHILEQSDTIPELQKIDFKAANIVSISAKDVDLEYAVKGNRDTLLTDSEIARRQNGQAGERELEEWRGAPLESGEDMSLDGGSGDAHANGWSAEEMFKTNEARYGVTSSYDDSLPEYTTSLDRSNPKVYQERVEKADKLAREIELSSSYSTKSESDDITEEDRFSAVSGGSENAPNRYVPPHMRDTRGPSPGVHRRTQAPPLRTPGQGRPQMISPHHAHPAPHAPTQPHSQPRPQSHPHQQQQMPVHSNIQTRVPQAGMQPQHSQQQQQQQQQQQVQMAGQLHQRQQQPPQQQKSPMTSPHQQLPKPHSSVPQPQAQPHISPHAPSPNPQTQATSRGQSPVQIPPRPTMLRTQSPTSPSLPNTEQSSSSSNVTEEKPQQNANDDRPQSVDDTSSNSRNTQPSHINRTPDTTTISSEKIPKNVQEKTLADLKEFSNSFNLEGKPSDEEAPSAPSTQSPAPTVDTKPATTGKTTPTLPPVTGEREGKDTGTSSGKASPVLPSKEKETQLNPLAKEFVPTRAVAQLPQRGIPTKTPTPPISQSYSPIHQFGQPIAAAGSPYYIAAPQGYPVPQQAPVPHAQAQAQAAGHMGPKQMMPKKGFSFPGPATNMPHPRPQPPTDLPAHVIATGQPLISPINFQPHPGQMIHYQPQQGLPGQIAGQQIIPQPGPYQFYPQKHAVQIRQMQPQPSIQGIHQPQPAPHLHSLQEPGLPGASSVLVPNTTLQVSAGQVQQQMQHPMHAHLHHHQQQQQQQQQQHAQQQQTQQQAQQQQAQQPQHHPHPQSVVHLTPQQQQQQQQQHQHPHAQPHTTPPQSHVSQPSPMAQSQQQQQQHRPSPSPVHHMTHLQHQGHPLPHVSQPQPQPHAHHLHPPPQGPQILYHSTSLQQGPLPLAVQSSQQQQQQQFAGPHQYPPQYMASAATTTLPATNITSLTHVHSNVHTHPTQTNVVFVPPQGQMVSQMMHSSGQLTTHIPPQSQGLGQPHGQVPTYQAGN